MNNKNSISVQSMIIAILLSAPSYAESTDGIILIKSSNSVSSTMDKMETSLKANGMTIFTRVNHAAGAEKAGLVLRPTELLIFGNPAAGTPLILCAQTAALDLPQKALAYEDASGQVWLAYNDPHYLAKRHDIQGCDEPLEKVGNALRKFAETAVK